MIKVYHYALSNISALDITDCREGIFFQRDPQKNSPSFVYSRYSKEPGRELRLGNTRFWRLEVDNAMINLRGWVIQERLLAKRILYFGKNQLFWECQELRAYEQYPDVLLEDGNTITLFPNLHIRSPCFLICIRGYA